MSDKKLADQWTDIIAASLPTFAESDGFDRARATIANNIALILADPGTVDGWSSRAPRHLDGETARRAGWLADAPDCRTCGELFQRRPSNKDGRPDYSFHRPECPSCFEKRVRASKAT